MGAGRDRSEHAVQGVIVAWKISLAIPLFIIGTLIFTIRAILIIPASEPATVLMFEDR